MGDLIENQLRAVKKPMLNDFLKNVEVGISDGKLPGVCFGRVKFDELAEDFLRGVH